MAFPANGLRGMLSGIDLSEWGKGPGHSLSEPIWRCTQISPTVSTIQSIITAAYTYDMVIMCNFSGARASWTNPVTNPDGSTSLIFDIDKYTANVQKFAGLPNIQQAINDRKLINFVIDEPFLDVFAGSIPKSTQNQLGLLHKSIWTNALTAMRSPSAQMTPPPAGGWTGIDYGWSQFNRAASNSGLTKRQWYAQEKAGLAAVGCGMVPALNWLNGGDGRNWDFLNTGSSSGRIVGADGAPFWLCSPQEIMDIADAIFDDPDAPGFLGFTWASADFEADMVQYQDRSDFVAAFDYGLNKMASRPVFNGFRTPKGYGTVTPPGTGPEIDHFASTPVTTRVSTVSGNYVDVPGAIITADNLTPGKQYLVVATGAFDLSSTSAEAYVRVVQDTVAQPRSESAFTVNQTTAKLPYFWWGVLTAADLQDIKLQFKSSDGVATVGANLCQLFAMNLSDQLVNGADWKFAESTTSTSLTTAYQDGASITFTPANANDDWLVLTSAHFQSPSLSQSVVSGIRRGGENVSTDPEVQAEGEDARDLYRLSNARVYTLGNAVNTFAEQSKNTGGGGPRDGSAVFALRLNAFASHGFAYDNTPVALGTTKYGNNTSTASIATTANGDVWMLGSLGYVAVNLVSMRARLTLDLADSPAGQTAADTLYSQSFDSTDVLPIMLSSVASQTAGAHTVKMDASVNSGGSNSAIGRLGMVVSMALSATTGGTLFRHQNRLGTRNGTRKIF